PRGSPSARASRARRAGSPCGRTRPATDRPRGNRGLRKWELRWRCSCESRSPGSRFDGSKATGGARTRGDAGHNGYRPPMEEGIRVGGDTVIPLEEIELRASRSSGPGGQHANVTASRIEAVFDVEASEALSAAQRDLLRRKLGARVTAVSQDARSQARNRELALERLREKIAAGARRPTPARPPQPPPPARARRPRRQ